MLGVTNGHHKDTDLSEKQSTLAICNLKLTDQEANICLSNKNLDAIPNNLSIPLDVNKFSASNNLFVTFPEAILKLEKIEFINLAFNKIIHLPEEISKLKHLKVLNIKGNELEDLPESLGNLLCLQKLDASQNKLSEVPVSLGRLRNLTVIDLSHNLINSMPIALSCLECLTWLDMSHNSIVLMETKPQWLNTICVLRIQNNLLEILPEWLNEASKLRCLNVSHNPLLPQRNSSQGFLETRLNKNREGKKSNLQILDLKNCGIETYLPPKLYCLENLVELHLGNDGPPYCPSKQPDEQYNVLLELPSWFATSMGALLQVLNLSHMQLCGLPHDLSPLQHLQVLLLKGNPLMWLPQSFTKLINLKVCDLSDCQLLKLPATMGDMEILGKLDLSNNKLSLLPDSIQFLNSLKYLDVYNNHLEEVPQFCFKLQSLEAMDLGYNYFSPLEQLYGDDLECYIKLKDELRTLLSGEHRSDEMQLPLLTDFECGESQVSEEPPEENVLCQPDINGFPYVDHFNVGLPEENWDESEDDGDDNFDPYTPKGPTWLTPPRWSNALQSEHYFCPGDNHPPHVSRRAVWSYQLPEAGQFDDAD